MNEVDDFFGLEQPAFGPVRDPGQIFRSGLIGPLAKEVLAGTAVVTVRGGHGVGKTSFMHVLAMDLAARNLTTAVIDGVAASPDHVRNSLAASAGLAAEDGPPERLLRALWHQAGIKRLVLLCDNAETLPEETFRYLAQLLKLRVSQPIGLQLVLIGAPGAWPGLAAPDLDGLRQASDTSYTTLSLRKEEAAAYLDHRLRQAGQTLGRLMTPSAAVELRERARCNPRRLDELAQQALLYGFRTGRRRLTARSVRQALLTGSSAGGARPRRTGLAAIAVVALGGAAAGLAFWMSGGETSPAPANRASPPPAVATRANPTPAVRVAVVTPIAAKPIAPSLAPPPIAKGAPAPPVASAAPASQAAAGGLVLIAGPRDDLASLYARVYRGLTPPAYSTVLAANTGSVRPGSLVVFPEPPSGWTRR